MKPSMLKKVLRTAIDNFHPMLVVSPPGCGKTDIIKQVVAAMGLKLMIVHLVVRERVDFGGMPWVRIDDATGEMKADFVPFGQFLEMIRADEKIVVFFDDFGQASEDVQKAIMQILLERSLNGHKISDNVTFLAATNDRGHKAGVAGILEPVKSRFISIVYLNPDVYEWIEWSIDAGLPHELPGFMAYQPDYLTAFEATKDLVNSPCPRTIANIGKIMMANYPEEAWNELFEGAAGKAFASGYTGWLRNFHSLPSSPHAVLDNPDSVDLDKITEPSALYALCSSIAHLCNDHKKPENVFRFAQRIPREYGKFTVLAATTKNPELKECSEYVQWAVNDGNARHAA